MAIKKSKIRWTAVAVIALVLAVLAYGAVAYGHSPAQDQPARGGDQPIPVDIGGGIGDTPIPVEPVR